MLLLDVVLITTFPASYFHPSGVCVETVPRDLPDDGFYDRGGILFCFCRTTEILTQNRRKILVFQLVVFVLPFVVHDA